MEGSPASCWPLQPANECSRLRSSAALAPCQTRAPQHLSVVLEKVGQRTCRHPRWTPVRSRNCRHSQPPPRPRRRGSSRQPHRARARRRRQPTHGQKPRSPPPRLRRQMAAGRRTTRLASRACRQCTRRSRSPARMRLPEIQLKARTFPLSPPCGCPRAIARVALSPAPGVGPRSTRPPPCLLASLSPGIARTARESQSAQPFAPRTHPWGGPHEIFRRLENV